MKPLQTKKNSQVAGDPIIQLPKGKIRGHILRSTRGQQYYAFQQIPYAAPPTGINRFKVIHICHNYCVEQ